MRRRHFLYGAAFALAAPAVYAQSSRAQTLKLVPLTSLYSLDTIFNTSLVTTNHGWAVYDSLFGMNSKGEIKPQMAEGYILSDDGRIYEITLREGLKFHNGEPVRAQADLAGSTSSLNATSSGNLAGNEAGTTVI
jgi:peptide/nickel transport system substrate-binding protein